MSGYYTSLLLQNELEILKDITKEPILSFHLYNIIISCSTQACRLVEILYHDLKDILNSYKMDDDDGSIDTNDHKVGQLKTDLSGAVTEIISGKMSKNNSAITGSDVVEREGNNTYNDTEMNDEKLDKIQTKLQIIMSDITTLITVTLEPLLNAMKLRYDTLGYKEKSTTDVAVVSDDNDDDDDPPSYHLDSFNITVLSVVKRILREMKALEYKVDSEEPLYDLLDVDIIKMKTIPSNILQALLPFME